MADAADLKSAFPEGKCEFESHRAHFACRCGRPMRASVAIAALLLIDTVDDPAMQIRAILGQARGRTTSRRT